MTPGAFGSGNAGSTASAKRWRAPCRPFDSNERRNGPSAVKRTSFSDTRCGFTPNFAGTTARFARLRVDRTRTSTGLRQVNDPNCIHPPFSCATADGSFRGIVRISCRCRRIGLPSTVTVHASGTCRRLPSAWTRANISVSLAYGTSAAFTRP